MAQILQLSKLNQKAKKQIVRQIRQGAIFIYPTDTIYGIGCSALIPKAVKKIRKIKNSNNPFSVIPPSKRWVYSNLKIGRQSIDFIKKLPGPFTFILKLKDKNNKAVCKEVFGDFQEQTLGIRIPLHSFTKIIQESNCPFITTSVNLHGLPPLTDIKKIPGKIAKAVDIIIDAGILDNKPSAIIDITGSMPIIIRKS